MRDPLEPAGPCADCAAGPPAVTAWSPAFAAVLCTGCRSARTGRALAATEQANAAARRRPAGPSRRFRRRR